MYLLFGLVTNVAVAWGLVLLVPTDRTNCEHVAVWEPNL